MNADNFIFDPTKNHWVDTTPKRPKHHAKVVYDAYRDIDGQWRWRAWAHNGKIVATSGEGYKRKIDCLKMADLLRSIGRPLYEGFPLFVEGVLQ